MSQLGALIWLKWRLFRNAMRSRKAATNRIASALGTLAALTLALFIALTMGIAAYGLTANTSGEEQVQGMFLIFAMVASAYLVWATLPLSLGGGNQFNPERLMLYPISLRKLFAIDMLSELTSLASIFAVPSVLALALGAGLRNRNVLMALGAAVCAILFGVALAKLFSTAIGSLMQKRRTRGETLIALIGAIGGLAGGLMGQLAPSLDLKTFPSSLGWTPPGAVALALTSGLRVDGAATYIFSLAILMTYTLVAITVTYWIACRTLMGAGGAKRRTPHLNAEGQSRTYRGWQLPFLSAELSMIVEKELRYAVRNAQLRVVALMPIILSLSFKIAQSQHAGQASGFLSRTAPYTEGMQPALSVFYVFLVLSSISCNLFAYDGDGMRALILAPVDRRTILIGKNIAVVVIAFVFAVAATVVNEMLSHNLSFLGLIFAVLCFVFFASMFAIIGNWLSMYFPKRLQFGKRMNASGTTGLLLLPIFIGMLLPPAAAIWAGYLARSLVIKYVILAACAGVAVALYFMLITSQGRKLAQRELAILEAVTGKTDE